MNVPPAENKYFVHIKMLLKVILLSLIYIQTFAQTAKSEIEFEFDYATFSYNNAANYIELYYAVNQKSLLTLKRNDSLIVSAILEVSIKDIMTDSVAFTKKYLVQSVKESFDEYEQLLGQINVSLESGMYLINISLQDMIDTNRVKSYEEALNVEKFNPNYMVISDIEICSNIIMHSQNKESIFYKNTMEVVPNPFSTFSNKKPMLFYYLEVYNLKRDTTVSDVKLQTRLFNSVGDIILEKTKPLSKRNNSIVQPGVLNLSKFPSGTYSLSISALDGITGKGVSSVKRFYYYNPNVIDSTLFSVTENAFLASEFAVMSEDECDNLINMSKILGSTDEIDRYYRLDKVEQKREFLYAFWKRRDPVLTTPRNEALQEFRESVKYVNQMFGEFGKKGIETHRGRVYLVYGEPNEIDRHPNEYDLKPYEIWYYDNYEGGVEFIFADINGLNIFELIHSTKTGELRDDNWQRRLGTSSSY